MSLQTSLPSNIKKDIKETKAIEHRESFYPTFLVLLPGHPRYIYPSTVKDNTHTPSGTLIYTYWCTHTHVQKPHIKLLTYDRSSRLRLCHTSLPATPWPRTRPRPRRGPRRRFGAAGATGGGWGRWGRFGNHHASLADVLDREFHRNVYKRLGEEIMQVYRVD